MTDEPADAEIQILSPDAVQSGFSYFDTTPESPTGEHVTYVRWTELPAGDGEPAPAELWVCRRDRSDHRKVTDIEACSDHNGARAQWVDDRRIAYMDGDRTFVVELDSGERSRPYPGRIGHEVHDGWFLLAVNADCDLGPPGAYEVNGRTGDTRRILRHDRLDRLSLPEYIDPDPLTEWSILHLQYSTDGSHVALRFDPAPSGSSGERARLLVTCDRDGEDLRMFGPKPMHFAWYDDSTLMGHDHQVSGTPDDNYVRRWSRTGECIETLAGPGNHLAVSDDRTSFASDTWYGSDPVELRVYARGSMDPDQQIFSSPYADLVWNRHAHVNPAFSRDGTRLYFTYPVDDDRFQAACAEVAPDARTH